MTIYYEKIEHANSSDEEEEVLTISSTREEKKKIRRIIIFAETNAGILRWYISREKIGWHRTGKASIQNGLVFDVDHELEVGDEFKVTLQNKVSGTYAEIYGVVEYEITAT